MRRKAVDFTIIEGMRSIATATPTEQAQCCKANNAGNTEIFRAQVEYSLEGQNDIK
jgi:hypothetical protein